MIIYNIIYINIYKCKLTTVKQVKTINRIIKILLITIKINNLDRTVLFIKLNVSKRPFILIYNII
jgi:hypothetical protein